jgi:hypothetical protein
MIGITQVASILDAIEFAVVRRVLLLSQSGRDHEKGNSCPHILPAEDFSRKKNPVGAST